MRPPRRPDARLARARLARARGRAVARLALLPALALLVALALALPSTLRAEEEPGLADAIAKGKVTLDLRYRYELVSDDSGDRDAHAPTLRTALGYITRAHNGFSFQIEAENVTAIGNDLYDNAGFGAANNRMPDRSVVADPEITEINQALVRYRGHRWQVAAGRQEINLGDVRFVGNVGWRQNHQSFDALRLDNSSLGGLRLTYVYAGRVNRITDESRDLAAHLLNVGFELQNAGKFTLYGYLVDWRDRDLAGQSTATWGLEFAGRRRLAGGRTLLYEAELARQSDHADNPARVDVGYWNLMLGVELPWATVRLARESLGGGAGKGRFQTPLATLHKFNGWADKFLSTPPAGLVDLSLQLQGKMGEVGWQVKLHRFDSETGSISYGEELDVELVYELANGLRLGLKGALYDADRFSFDTDKWMLWATYGF